MRQMSWDDEAGEVKPVEVLLTVAAADRVMPNPSIGVARSIGAGSYLVEMCEAGDKTVRQQRRVRTLSLQPSRATSHHTASPPAPPSPSATRDARHQNRFRYRICV